MSLTYPVLAQGHNKALEQLEECPNNCCETVETCNGVCKSKPRKRANGMELTMLSVGVNEPTPHCEG